MKKNIVWWIWCRSSCLYMFFIPCNSTVAEIFKTYLLLYSTKARSSMFDFLFKSLYVTSAGDSGNCPHSTAGSYLKKSYPCEEQHTYHLVLQHRTRCLAVTTMRWKEKSGKTWWCVQCTVSACHRPMMAQNQTTNSNGHLPSLGFASNPQK